MENFTPRFKFQQFCLELSDMELMAFYRHSIIGVRNLSQRRMYFSVPGKAKISGEGSGFISTRVNFKGVFSIGGPVEKTGRLKYINGCSDSLIIPPVTLGDPCFNLLHVPPHIDQTTHTHPTVRVGMVLSGEGICIGIDKEYPLISGKIFILYPDCLHSFHTKDNTLRIVVYHPDSDSGPSHDSHPMLNRSYVEGVSASKIDDIRTK